MPLPNPYPNLDDLKAEIERLRSAVERDPEKYEDLQFLIDRWPDDPEEDIDLRAPGEQPRGNNSAGGRQVLSRVHQHTDLLERPQIITMARDPQRVKHKTNPFKAYTARLELYQENVNRLVDRYERGDINIEQLSAGMREEIKGMYISAAVAGKGGEWEDMTYEDWGRVGGLIGHQYGFLDARIRSIEEGRETIGQARSRLLMYGESASQIFERNQAGRTGLNIDILPAWPGSGDTKCYTNCKCWWQIRTLSKARGDYDCIWRLGIVVREHCITCRRRADEWAPIKVRGNQLQEPVTPIVG